MILKLEMNKIHDLLILTRRLKSPSYITITGGNYISRIFKMFSVKGNE